MFRSHKEFRVGISLDYDFRPRDMHLISWVVLHDSSRVRVHSQRVFRLFCSVLYTSSTDKHLRKLELETQQHFILYHPEVPRDLTHVSDPISGMRGFFLCRHYQISCQARVLLKSCRFNEQDLRHKRQN